MAYRQIQVAVPGNRASALEEACLGRGADHVTRIASAKEPSEELLFVVCEVGLAGPMLHLITRWFSQERLGLPGFVMLPVHAVEPVGDGTARGTGRASWEEMQADLATSANLSTAYLAFILLAASLAALGLLADDATIVIASMVVAPLLGPLMGIALGTVRHDMALLRKALTAEVVGLALAVLVGVLVGLVAPEYLLMGSKQIQTRTQPDLTHLGLAIGAGVAGALSLASAALTNLVGVAVAVALMPPAIVLGLSIGTNRFDMAAGAGLLLLVNILGCIVASIAAFRLFRILPTPRLNLIAAVRSTRVILLVVGLLLAVSVWPLMKWSQFLVERQAASDEVTALVHKVAGDDLRIHELHVTPKDDYIRVEVMAEGGFDLSGVDLGPLHRDLVERFGEPVELTLRVIPTTKVTVGP